MKRILMIAYHFPPLTGSSGIQRTLRFVQHLPAFGWQPSVNHLGKPQFGPADKGPGGACLTSRNSPIAATQGFRRVAESSCPYLAGELDP